MYALSLLLVVPDIDRLGGQVEWSERELAELRLRNWGLLAVPEIYRAALTHPDPEVRYRCQRLLVPWFNVRRDLEASAILCGSHSRLQQAFLDPLLRRRLYQLAVLGGCDELHAHQLLPESDVWCWFLAMTPPQVLFYDAVRVCSRKVRLLASMPLVVARLRVERLCRVFSRGSIW